MDLSSEEKRIFDIFNDLQKDRQKDGITINLICKSRNLVLDKKIDNSQGNKSKNEIKFNPDYFHEALLKNDDDNLILFALLHEEAHIRNDKSSIRETFYVFFGILIILSVGIAYSPVSFSLIFQGTHYEISNLISATFFLIVCLLIGIPAIWRYGWDAMFEDELNADYYGAECLSIYFNDKDPSTTITPFFIEDNSVQEKERIARKKQKMKLYGFYPDYHPSNAERLARIRLAFSHSEKTN